MKQYFIEAEPLSENIYYGIKYRYWWWPFSFDTYYRVRSKDKAIEALAEIKQAQKTL